MDYKNDSEYKNVSEIGKKESYTQLIEIAKKYFRNFREIINSNFQPDNSSDIQNNNSREIFMRSQTGEIIMRRKMVRVSNQDFPTTINEDVNNSVETGGTSYITFEGETYKVSSAPKPEIENPSELSPYDQVVLDGIYRLLEISVEDSISLDEDSKKVTRFVPGKNLDTLDPQSIEYQYAIQQLSKRLVLEHLLGNPKFGTDDLGNYRLGIDGNIYQNSLIAVSNFFSAIENDWATMYEPRDISPATILNTGRNIFNLSDAQIFIQILKIVEKQEEILNYIDTMYKDELSVDAKKRISKIKYVISQRIEDFKKFIPMLLRRSKEMQMVLVSDTTREYISLLPQVEINGNPELREALISNIILREAEAHQYFVDGAKKRNMTVEEFKRQLQLNVEQSVAESELFTCVEEGVLEKILTQGRFKTIFETKRGGGDFRISTRSEVENNLFGFPIHRDTGDVDPRTPFRPVYGYMSNNRFGGITETGGSDNPESVKQYGNIVVKLRRQVKNKATCAFGDTLGKKVDPAPSPVNAPHFTSLTNAGIGSSRLGRIETSNVSTYNSIFRVENNPRYTEVQFHNGLLALDIEEIILPSNIDQATKQRVKSMVNEFNKRNPSSVIKVIER